MIFWSGALIAVLYSFAIGGILFAVPIGKLSIVTGTWDALAVLGKEWGRAGDTVVFLLGLGFLYACVANVVTWSLGANRVAAVAAEEGMLPEALGPAAPALQDAVPRVRRDGRRVDASFSSAARSSRAASPTSSGWPSG